MERDEQVGSDRAYRSRDRRESTGRIKELMKTILQLEADGADHTELEIDRVLARVARDLGYSEEDIIRLLPTGRSVFRNDGEWAKAKLIEERLHDVVGKHVYWESDIRRECYVYRITPTGLDEVRRHS